MKKIILILGACFLTSSFTPRLDVATVADICTIYANQQAALAVENGGNYYEAWFQAYGECGCVRNGGC